MKQKFIVIGMTCSACSAHVEKAVSKVPGVSAVAVNLLAGSYGEATRRFRAAVDSAVERSETAPKMKLSDWGNTALSSTITDDRTREYYLPPY